MLQPLRRLYHFLSEDGDEFAHVTIMQEAHPNRRQGDVIGQFDNGGRAVVVEGSMPLATKIRRLKRALKFRTR